jgi:uncharacterized membrane protein
MTSRSRITSLDLLRGAVMVLMAIDHVRVYAGVPAGGPTAGLFFTRWVTHFCAPVFVFLAGTSAFLYGRQLANRGALAKYLVTRGLLLVLLELTVIRASWTFGVDYSSFILAGVIWMLGWCMVLLAGLVWLPPWSAGLVGLAVIVFQDLFRPIGVALFGQVLPETWRPIWELIYPVGAELTLGAGGPAITVLYSIVPWIGVMAAGYGFGLIMLREPADRRRLCLTIGLVSTALFVMIAGAGVLVRGAGDGPPLLFQMLNQRKYPASALYLLMTLGPAIALLPLAERARGPIAGVFETFGRVPMFYYLLHIPVIHAVALFVWRIRDGAANDARFATAPYVSMPADQRWGLPLLYLVFVVVVVLLYFPCRWFARVKAGSSTRWLRYL